MGVLGKSQFSSLAAVLRKNILNSIVLLAILCSAGLTIAGNMQAHAATVFLDESFRNSTITQGNWTAVGSGGGTWGVGTNRACLTARNGSGGDSSGIPGCNTPGLGGVVEAEGAGALRFTSNATGQSGTVIHNETLSSGQGLKFEFDMFMYDGTDFVGRPGDGISFFLTDGSAALPTTPGAAGSGLGYARSGRSTNWLGQESWSGSGVVGGYVGVGFDRFGNYSTQDSGPGAPLPFMDTGRSNGIALRGSASSNYRYITGKVAAGQLDTQSATVRDNALRKVRITISTSNIMNVDVDYSDGNGYVSELSNVDLNTINGTTFPSTFRFGFSASTGDARQAQEIRNLVVQTLEPDLSTTITPSQSTYTVNDSLSFAVSVENDASGGPTSEIVTSTTTFPTELTPTAASGTDWDCTVAGQTVTCTRDASIAAGGSAPDITINTTPAVNANGVRTIETSVATQDDVDTSNNNASTTVTQNQVAAIIAAENDSATGVSGVTGQQDVLAVLANDTLSGTMPPSTALNITAVGSIPSGIDFNTTTGLVSVLPNTPAGTHTFDYQICEKANPTNCDTATVSITVVTPPIEAKNDNFSGGNTAVGNASAGNVLTNDEFNGTVGLTVDDVTISNVSPASGTPSGVVLDPSTGNVSVAAGTPAGSYDIEYTIQDKVNPSNTSTATVTVVVSATPITATDDTIPGEGGSVLDNDVLGSDPATSSNVTVSVADEGDIPGVTIAEDGTVIVPEDTPAGTHTFDYQICEKANPTNCDTATVSIVVNPHEIIAGDKDYTSTPIPTTAGGTTPTVLDVVTIEGDPGTPGTTDLTIVTDGGLTDVAINDDGTITVPPSTVPGDYSVTYQACETANPTNCDTGVVVIRVESKPIEANDDDLTGTPIQQTAGGSTTTVLVNDTLDGDEVTSSTVVPTIVANGGLEGVSISNEGVISVPAGTVPGTYNVEYRICESDASVPSNCDTAIARVLVIATPISIDDDDFSSSPVPNTGGPAGNVFDNDTIGDNPADSGNATVTVVDDDGLTGVIIDEDGNVTVPGGTTPGTYEVEYQACERDVTPANCGNATVTIVIAETPIVANDDTYSAVNGNTGNSNVGVIVSNDTLGGDAVGMADITLTITNPLPAGVTIDTTTGQVAVAPGTDPATHQIEYRICETARPANCDTSIVTLDIVDAPGVVAATDDSFGSVTDGPAGNVFDNDTVNSNTATNGNATVTVVDDGGLTGVTIGDDGILTVPEGVPAGTYEVEYRLCERNHPTNCDAAVATVVVTAKPIAASDDTYGPINGRTGGAAGYMLTNDTLGGDPVVASGVTVTVQGAMPHGITLNNNTGDVQVAPNTPAGTYTFTYQICENLNPTNCDTATVGVTVTAAPIVADDLTTDPLVDGPAGNVFDGGSLDGDPLTENEIDLTVENDGGLTDVSINPNGDVIVPTDTPAGSYDVEYQACEKLNPTNCDTAVVHITVIAPTIVAIDDNLGEVNSKAGGSLDSTLGNDRLSNEEIDQGRVTITPVGALPAGVSIDGTTGVVTIAPATPKGDYSFEYQICHTANPTVCDTANVTFTVTNDDVIAAEDVHKGEIGSNGGAVANITEISTLNNQSVRMGEVDVTIIDGAGISGITISENGDVIIPANVKPGSYTITYQVCQKSDQSNCAQAIITFEVKGDEIAAPNTGFARLTSNWTAAVSATVAGVIAAIGGYRLYRFKKQ